MRGGVPAASADICNRGSRAADEVVQLYVHPVAASVAQPARWLKGFRRISLRSGETQTVYFTISRGDLAYRNQQLQLVAEPGRYQLWIAPDSVRGLEAAFTVR